MNSPCPCGSGSKYKKCCQPFHKGKIPKTALELMRSRYSAFAFSLSKYIINTTHKENPDYCLDTQKWKEDILDFSNNFTFVKLTILEFVDGDEKAYVTFHANILLDEKDASFTEKSTFKRCNNRWLYHSGISL